MEGPSDPTQFMGGGILRLGAKLTAGEYLLQVTATDELAPKKYSQAVQWIDFEVTEKPGS